MFLSHAICDSSDLQTYVASPAVYLSELVVMPLREVLLFKARFLIIHYNYILLYLSYLGTIKFSLTCQFIVLVSALAEAQETLHVTNSNGTDHFYSKICCLDLGLSL
jgi:hypothetical protein